MVTINSSIVLIALPDIFRGIHLNPLTPSNTPYFLWLLMGFLVATAVLVVTFGRIGDMYGRVKMYNLGFAVFTFFSILLSISWMNGPHAALYLVVMRILQGVGGALLFANSSAILTDAFPENQRGLALGINAVAAIAGSFIGLILGGLLGPVSWRLVFVVSVPVGLFGTVWAYLKLRELSTPRRSRIDWPGNITFALGLILIMVAVTYGIRPAGHSNIGWGAPRTLALLAAGVACLAGFVIAERRTPEPMFRLPLFKIRAFTFGTLST
ncbi:MAG: MFS transporter, partial [Acidimicrobiales bacterium]